MTCRLCLGTGARVVTRTRVENARRGAGSVAGGGTLFWSVVRVLCEILP